MQVRQLDPESFIHAYNVDLQMLYPWDGVVEPPFGAAWAVLAPGESTKPHAHHECETFFVARGQGEMAIGDERHPVRPGTVTFHRPFDNHVLTNTGDEDLHFVTVYWEDKGRWTGDPARRPEGEGEAEARVERVMVTAAPPTPNGDLHLGHLSGPYLSGDVYTRALRQRGIDAHFICGTDDNSIFVRTKGAELGISGEEAADRFAGEIGATLEAAGIHLAEFPRPNASPFHKARVQEFFEVLHDRGHLVEKEAPALFSPSTGQYAFEAYVQGTSPHTGETVVGHICEDTGRVYDPVELLDPVLLPDGETPEVRPARRLFFPLSRWEDRLRDFYRRVSMGSHLRSLCDRLLAEGLPDIAVTHWTDWGIEVPVEGYEDQRIFVWLEMAPRYLAYAQHVNRATGVYAGWERFWKEPTAEVVQFFGYDNSFYYAMFLPALFMAFDEELRLPTAYVTNEFYKLDGQKFSTSRGHRILGRELTERVPRDAVRFFLAATCPEREETNFTLAAFEDLVRRELLGSWSDWLADLGRRLAEDWDGQVPATGDWTEEQRRFYLRLQELMAQIGRAWEAEGFSPQRATRLMGEIVREARRFGRGEEHWKGAPNRGEERRTAAALEVLAAKLLGIAAAPVMPELAERLWRALGYDTGPGDGCWEETPEWVPGGQKVSGLDDLFPGLAEAMDALEGAQLDRDR